MYKLMFNGAPTASSATHTTAVPSQTQLIPFNRHRCTVLKGVWASAPAPLPTEDAAPVLASEDSSALSSVPSPEADHGTMADHRHRLMGASRLLNHGVKAFQHVESGIGTGHPDRQIPR